MRTPLVIVGCGGFGREVFSIVEAVNADGGRWSVVGFVDDAPTVAARAAVEAVGSQVIGVVAALDEQPAGTAVVIAVGSPPARSAISHRLRGMALRYPVLVHPDATVGRSVELDEGVVLAPGARLSTGIQVGRHVQIDQNATVGHDTRIGNFARLNPQACVSGAVTIGDRALVGAGATVLQGRSIGVAAIVGAAACVVHDVAAGVTVKGVPAR